MKSLIIALIEAQHQFRPLVKSASNPFFKSKYATLDACIDATREALAKNGLCVVQPVTMDGEKMTLTTRLLHDSGEEIVSIYPVVPVKADPQGFGSAITYARRYAYCAILGLVADEDDDGNAGSHAGAQKQAEKTASAPKPAASTPRATDEHKSGSAVITAAQLQRLHSVATETGLPRDVIKAIVQINGFASSKEITQDKYNEIVETIINEGKKE
jgi:hypothetical protein